VMTAVDSESDAVAESACTYTPQTAKGAPPPPPPPPPGLTCFDYDQRPGNQAYPCPDVTPMKYLRSDSEATDCLPSRETSCNAATCCMAPAPPMTCIDTDGDGTNFDCGVPWTSDSSSVPVIPFYELNENGVCTRSEGHCTPMVCCTVPPVGVGFAHDVESEEFPQNAVRTHLRAAACWYSGINLPSAVQVEAFYVGVDTKNETLMYAKVSRLYQVCPMQLCCPFACCHIASPSALLNPRCLQAIFTEGCVSLGGSTHCGSGKTQQPARTVPCVHTPHVTSPYCWFMVQQPST
jgi:hypothetical protein